MRRKLEHEATDPKHVLTVRGLGYKLKVKRHGLRARVVALFGVGALLLTTTLALVTFGLTRHNVIDERERTAVRAAYFDAAVVRQGRRASPPTWSPSYGRSTPGRPGAR